MRRRVVSFFFLGVPLLSLLGSIGCLGRTAPTPGMVTVSPAPEEGAAPSSLAVPLPTDGSHSIVVAYPRHPGASMSSAVFVDPDGRFLGSVTAGTSTILRVPKAVKTIHAFSSVEVTASRGTWFAREDISLERRPEAILVVPYGPSRYRLYATTRASLEPKIAQLAWIEADGARGTAWLEAHRARVDEVLERNPPRTPEIISVVRLR